MLTDDDGRPTDACLYYKLTYEPSGSVRYSVFHILVVMKIPKLLVLLNFIYS